MTAWQALLASLLASWSVCSAVASSLSKNDVRHEFLQQDTKARLSGFEAAVVAPILLQDTFASRVDPRRQLEDDTVCFESNDPNIDLLCLVNDYPASGFFLIYGCPPDYSSAYDCRCYIGFGDANDPDAPTCDGCIFCKDDTAAFDCKNIASGDCVQLDCNDRCGSNLQSLAPDPAQSAAVARATPYFSSAPLSVGLLLIFFQVFFS